MCVSLLGPCLARAQGRGGDCGDGSPGRGGAGAEEAGRATWAGGGPGTPLGQAWQPAENRPSLGRLAAEAGCPRVSRLAAGSLEGKEEDLYDDALCHPKRTEEFTSAQKSSRRAWTQACVCTEPPPAPPGLILVMLGFVQFTFLSVWSWKMEMAWAQQVLGNRGFVK